MISKYKDQIFLARDIFASVIAYPKLMRLLIEVATAASVKGGGGWQEGWRYARCTLFFIIWWRGVCRICSSWYSFLTGSNTFAKNFPGQVKMKETFDKCGCPAEGC